MNKQLKGRVKLTARDRDRDTAMTKLGKRVYSDAAWTNWAPVGNVTFTEVVAPSGWVVSITLEGLVDLRSS